MASGETLRWGCVAILHVLRRYVDPRPILMVTPKIATEIIPAVACLSRTYSLQAQCFTLHSTAVMTEDDIKLFGTQEAPIFSSPGGVNAKIFGPDGRQLTEDLLATEEGIVYADLDLALIYKEKTMLDTCGYCSKPELLSLSRNTSLQPIVWSGRHS